MISLGGVVVNDNMYLGGLNSAPMVSSTQIRTIEGASFLMVKGNFGGRVLTLGTTNGSGSVMGIWCQDVLDDIIALEEAALPITLDYRGTSYDVVITGKSDFVPFILTEPEGPSKSFTGHFILTEV